MYITVDNKGRIMCIEVFGRYCLSFNIKTLISVSDAQGVAGPGLWEGNYQMVGNFDECLRQKATGDTVLMPNGSIGVHDFDGKYCRIYWFLDENFSVCITYKRKSGMKWHHTCDNMDQLSLESTMDQNFMRICFL